MFHLVTHAFFKALLFLAAGSVILGVERGHHHAAHHSKNHGKGGHHEEVFDPNDMRNMGGMRKTMPVTFWLYMIGTLALAGIFPFAGFWSKDEDPLDASLHYRWFISCSHRGILCRFLHGRQIDGLLRRARHLAAAHARKARWWSRSCS
jgi:NADH-quinone oxidoreductase subunit L